MQVLALVSTSWKNLLLWQTRAAELNSRMLFTLLSVLIYYYPGLLTIILSLFACHHIDPEFPADDEVNPPSCSGENQPPINHHLSPLW